MLQTLEECLVDLEKRIGDDIVKRNRLAKFVGVGNQALYTWFAGRNMPRGEVRLRLIVQLDFHGYKLKEFKALDKILQRTSYLVAFNLVTIDMVKNALGQMSNKSSHMLATLRGEFPLSERKVETLIEFNARYKMQLDDKLAHTKKMFLLGGSPQAKPPTQKAPRESSALTADLLALDLPGVMPEHMSEAHLLAVSNALASGIRMILPLAQILVKGPAKYRDQMRELAGRNATFDAANLLNSLCSETALTTNNQRNQK